MAALKKADEAKFKAICTARPHRRRLYRGRRERQSHRPEAGRQSRHARHLRLQLPRGECLEGEGRDDQRRRPDLSDDLVVQISGRAPALHLRQECARPGDPGDPRLRRRNHQGKRDRAQGLHARRRPGRRAGRVRARAQQAARTLTPVKFAELK